MELFAVEQVFIGYSGTASAPYKEEQGQLSIDIHLPCYHFTPFFRPIDSPVSFFSLFSIDFSLMAYKI